MLTIATITIDCRDPQSLSAFWSGLLSLPVGSNDEGEFWVSPSDETAPTLLFLPSTDARTGKNRIHLDLTPVDRDAEVSRALALGATRVEIGQTGEESWIVLADPEGNEFCILQAGNWSTS